MITFVGKPKDFDLEYLGLIPFMISENDPRPAREQFDENYQHGGGWKSFKGFEMLSNGDMQYDGDFTPTRLVAEAQFRNEVIRLYESSWVAIVQQDGSFEVSRMD